METIRVMIVDDQTLVCHGIQTILDMEPDISVVAMASNGREAINCARNLQPDIILMDLNMPVMDGVQSTREIVREIPSSRIIILTIFDDDNYVFEGVSAGAIGYLMKDVSAEDLINSVRTVAHGGAMVAPHVAAKILKQFGRLTRSTSPSPDKVAQPAENHLKREDSHSYGLTNREWDILDCLARGYSNKKIAESLHIADGTVKNHICHIFDKLQLRDRTQVALFAVKNRPPDSRTPLSKA